MKNLIFTTILIFSTAIKANIFVYCSEGSPSAFNPQITTDGTSNNASAHPITMRRFKKGSTEIEPGIAKPGIFQRTVRFYQTKETFFIKQNSSHHLES